jgi:uncharacterized membrane protein YfcA
MEFPYYILAGGAVGLAVGLTGVGGGSLMTPVLLAFGFPLHIAVGTDLLFAAITKTGGAVVHSVQRTVRWDLVFLLAAITTTLGITLILTSAAIIFRRRLSDLAARSNRLGDLGIRTLTPILGAVLGVLVTLSSVGAGAIATALLLIFYPKLKALNVVGTDIAHAVPLTLFAGLGHLFLGNVNLLLLVALLAGSIPAVTLGSRLARFVPDRVMRPLLATALCGIGIKFAFF